MCYKPVCQPPTSINYCGSKHSCLCCHSYQEKISYFTNILEFAQVAGLSQCGWQTHTRFITGLPLHLRSQLVDYTPVWSITSSVSYLLCQGQSLHVRCVHSALWHLNYGTLPLEVRNAETITTFRMHLKFHLTEYRLAYKQQTHLICTYDSIFRYTWMLDMLLTYKPVRDISKSNLFHNCISKVWVVKWLHTQLLVGRIRVKFSSRLSTFEI